MLRISLVYVVVKHYLYWKWNIYLEKVLLQILLRFFAFFRIEFTFISFISLSVICTKRLGRHFVNLFLLLYSPVGEYKECHVKFYQSERRISYIHLCENTKSHIFTREAAGSDRKYTCIIYSPRSCDKTDLFNFWGGFFQPCTQALIWLLLPPTFRRIWSFFYRTPRM